MQIFRSILGVIFILSMVVLVAAIATLIFELAFLYLPHLIAVCVVSILYSSSCIYYSLKLIRYID